MDNSIYEVNRDEYAGFISQLNKQKCDVEQFFEDNMTIIKIKSKKNGTHFCTRIIPEDDVEHYYIFNLPEDDEAVPPKAVMKVTLETKEEVQDFFNALNKLQQEKRNG